MHHPLLDGVDADHPHLHRALAGRGGELGHLGLALLEVGVPLLIGLVDELLAQPLGPLTDDVGRLLDRVPLGDAEVLVALRVHLLERLDARGDRGPLRRIELPLGAVAVSHGSILLLLLCLLTSLQRCLRRTLTSRPNVTL